MANLNDFFVTDGVNDVTAALFNGLLASTLRAEYRNVQTITATRNLTNADTPIQRLTPSGANRAVTFPTLGTGNHPFFIVNGSATYSLTLPGAFPAILPGKNALAFSDGVEWHVVSGSGGSLDPADLISADANNQLVQGTDDNFFVPAPPPPFSPLPSFEVTQTAGQSINNTTTTVIICDSELIDTGNCYNTTTGRFTANVAGTYNFSGALAMNAMADGKQVWVGFRKNGGTPIRWVGLANTSHASAAAGASGNQRFWLNGTTDYVELVVWHNHGAARNTYIGDNNSTVYWGGNRISPTNICNL